MPIVISDHWSNKCHMGVISLSLKPLFNKDIELTWSNALVWLYPANWYLSSENEKSFVCHTEYVLLICLLPRLSFRFPKLLTCLGLYQHLYNFGILPEAVRCSKGLFTRADRVQLLTLEWVFPCLDYNLTLGLVPPYLHVSEAPHIPVYLNRFTVFAEQRIDDSAKGGLTQFCNVANI